jgi:hypothetical protein
LRKRVGLSPIDTRTPLDEAMLRLLRHGGLVT